jgi:anti-sigma factor RsiW
MADKQNRAAGVGCVDAEQLAAYVDGRLDASARRKVEAHLARCGDCRTIFAETAAFAKRIVRPSRRTTGWIRHPVLSAVATLVVVGALGYVLWDREPPLPQGVTSPAYRRSRIRTSAPLGDVATAPSVLHWSAVEDAASYDVRVLEVDRTPLWSGSTSTPGIDLPSEVSALFAPGKTVVWEVTARDRSRAVIGESGAQQFRVAPLSRDR